MEYQTYADNYDPAYTLTDEEMNEFMDMVYKAVNDDLI